VPIACGDAPVFPGDVIVGDGDGVVVIPAHLADEIADEGFEDDRVRGFVMEKVHEGRSIVGLYPPTDPQTGADFALWRKGERAIARRSLTPRECSCRPRTRRALRSDQTDADRIASRGHSVELILQHAADHDDAAVTLRKMLLRVKRDRAWPTCAS